MSRLTISDVVLTVFGVAVLAGLYPVYSDLMAQNAGELEGPTLVAFQVAIPLAMVVLFALLAGRALGGSS